MIGSDIKVGLVIDWLKFLGVYIYIGYDVGNIEFVSVVVVLFVVKLDNLELVVVGEFWILVVFRVEMLGELMCYCYGIVVVGIYGKIIMISLIVLIFVEGGLDLIFVIGGLLNSVGINVCLGVSCYFVVEVDESDVFFLYL